MSRLLAIGLIANEARGIATVAATYPAWGKVLPLGDHPIILALIAYAICLPAAVWVWSRIPRDDQ